MAFTLLPAVDVAEGRAVRLVRGDAGTATTHGSPGEVALAWQAGGAEWIHLADLDAAFGRATDADLLAAVIGELDVPVQLSGGIHDDASLARALSTGCARVVLGTSALVDPAWCARVIASHGERVAVALDVRVTEDPVGPTQHRLAPRGSSRAGGGLWEALARLERDGCARYVVTDVCRDGTLHGPNLELYEAIVRATGARVLASGGIAGLGDLVALTDLATAGAGLEGAVLGSALTAGRFTLPEAVEAVEAVRRADGTERVDGTERAAAT